jgi:hypothetical protein
MKNLEIPRMDDVFSAPGLRPHKYHPRRFMNRPGFDVYHAEPVLEIELKKAVVPRREWMVPPIAAQTGRSNCKMIDD